MIHWRNWDFHLSMNSRVGPMISTVTYNDNGTKRKVMYEGSLGGMIVPYGDPDIGWYFKAYLDSGDYGMGTLTSPIARGKDAPSNAVLLNETIADYTGVPMEILALSRYLNVMPGLSISIRKWASPTSVPNAGSWWCAGSVQWVTMTTFLTGSSMKTALLALMPVLRASKR